MLICKQMTSKWYLLIRLKNNIYKLNEANAWRKLTLPPNYEVFNVFLQANKLSNFLLHWQVNVKIIFTILIYILVNFDTLRLTAIKDCLKIPVVTYIVTVMAIAVEWRGRMHGN